jgi:hypothetical protein
MGNARGSLGANGGRSRRRVGSADDVLAPTAIVACLVIGSAARCEARGGSASILIS